MGSMVKSYLPQLLDNQSVTPETIYHVTVMPCYDKKLEASRQDFYDDIYCTRDVDCVLTTGKILTFHGNVYDHCSYIVFSVLSDEISVNY